MKTGTQNRYGVLVAIVIAGLVIAGAVALTGNGRGTAINESNSGHTNTESQGEFRMPSDEDHMRGNSNATITIVEYSDFNCSFCARIHPTLSRIVEENEDVQWVYRHFANYAQGRVAAIGSECAAQIGGNDVFWEFSDRMFDNQRRLGDAFSIETAVSLGMNEEAFRTCLDDSKEIEAKIVADRNEAIALGGRGTPFAVVLTPTGNVIPFSGALPYEQIMSVVERARNN
ncbi:MAG: thioredoxin domain-containing protein [Candidatus Paceibacterota bacterium]